MCRILCFICIYLFYFVLLLQAIACIVYFFSVLSISKSEKKKKVQTGKKVGKTEKNVGEKTHWPFYASWAGVDRENQSINQSENA